MHRRLINPKEQLERVADEQLGFVSAGELARRAEQLGKQDANPGRNQLIISQETIIGFRANPGANGSSAMMTILPTASTTFDANVRNHYVPSPARVLVARITANGDLTAGTAMPELQITEGADVTLVTFDEASLDTTYPNSKAVAYEWERAPQIAGESTISMRVLTSAAYLPTTLDITISFTLGYAGWI